MTDCVRLYVFSEHNYVREEDYRAVLAQRKGFELAALDNETAAKEAKARIVELERSASEWATVDPDLHIEAQKIISMEASCIEWGATASRSIELCESRLTFIRQQAREAGRREECELLEALCEMRAKADSHYHARRAFLEVRDYLRKALIDSPKAEGEETK
jgi:hypothetical protein